MDEPAVQQVGLTPLDSHEPGEQFSEQVSQFRVGKLIAEAEMGTTDVMSIARAAMMQSQK